MSALTEIGNLLIQTFVTLYLTIVLLRFLLQLVRADFYNPVSQALVKATAPVLKPLRRIIPGLFGIDIAGLVLAIVVQMLGMVLMLLINGYGLLNPLYMLVWSVLGCIGVVIYIFYAAIIVSIIVSWVAPGTYNPIVLLLHQLTEPVMAPFRRILPPLGGLDLSPIFVFLLLNVLQIILHHTATAVMLPPQLVVGI